MLSIKIICVGKLKEKFYLEAAGEYAKRLGGYCKLTVTELPEQRLPQEPSGSEINAALSKEAQEIEKNIPDASAVIAMCVEGVQMDSGELAGRISTYAVSGISRLCFIIGGSYGLHESIKKKADMSLSMSKMTFPHHLARVMLLEQIYRAFKINEGSRYHK
ncbi:MAG: 23S rRNA (pseudouridine(1915)-N(3))-methyltransferase RlmH [Oscillospiraceae bacterium]|nr:23S rRNA (pseudouridine(1915)-N(3))-methyltransferase RlmH [Oscillospiraceae bacterium]